MIKFLIAFTLYSRHYKIVSQSTIALLFGLFPQIILAQSANQDFDPLPAASTASAVPSYTYTQTGGTLFTNHSYSPTQSYGVYNNNNGGNLYVSKITFERVGFGSSPTTTNKVTFRLGVFENGNGNNQGGLITGGKIEVNVAYNKSATFTPTLIINNSTNSNPKWDFSANGIASTVVTTPPITPASFPAVAADGSIGYGTVSITFGSLVEFVDVQIVLTAPNKTDIAIDNVVAGPYTSLPVELTRFNATAQTTGVNLTWATASEKNSAYFDVQRSATGEAYETLGRVAAQGSSSSLRAYEFLDARPLAGLAYYRLRQVDNDGTTAYSPVATARRGAEALTIYPNPSTEAVTLPASLGPVRYRVLNTLGQMMTSGQATGGDRLDLSTLPKGSFFLELTDAAGRHTQRLMRE